MFELCACGETLEAANIAHNFYRMGHSIEDILTNMSRVCKTAELPEYLKLEYMKVT